MIEQSILLHVQQSIYYTSSCGQSICNLNLILYPIKILDITSADADGGGGGGGAGAADHAGAGGDGGGDVSGEGGAGHHRLYTLGATCLPRLLLAVVLGRGVKDEANLGIQMVRRN